MSVNLYLALAGGLLVGALILGNPFLARPVHGAAGDVGEPDRVPVVPGAAADPQGEVVEARRPSALDVDSVELAGESFAVVTWQEDDDGRCLLMLEDGRVVTRAEDPEDGFRVVDLGSSTLRWQAESAALRVPTPPGGSDERR